MNNRYQKVKRLGEGSYGTVYLAIDTKPQGVKRRADNKALQLLDKVIDKESSGSLAQKGEKSKDNGNSTADVEMKESAEAL